MIPDSATYLVVKGEPASKANSRRKVTNRKTGKPMFIKSAKALAYEEAFKWQVAAQLKGIQPLEGDVYLAVRIYYASRRPDLDGAQGVRPGEAIDAFRDRVVANDLDQWRRYDRRENPHRADDARNRSAFRYHVVRKRGGGVRAAVG